MTNEPAGTKTCTASLPADREWTRVAPGDGSAVAVPAGVAVAIDSGEGVGAGDNWVAVEDGGSVVAAGKGLAVALGAAVRVGWGCAGSSSAVVWVGVGAGVAVGSRLQEDTRASRRISHRPNAGFIQEKIL